jgi:hypothetical protein
MYSVQFGWRCGDDNDIDVKKVKSLIHVYGNVMGDGTQVLDGVKCEDWLTDVDVDFSFDNLNKMLGEINKGKFKINFIERITDGVNRQMIYSCYRSITTTQDDLNARVLSAITKFV